MPKNCKWIDKIRYRTVWLIELARSTIQAGMTHYQQLGVNSTNTKYTTMLKSFWHEAPGISNICHRSMRIWIVNLDQAYKNDGDLDQ
jgi:hypothetical protein